MHYVTAIGRSVAGGIGVFPGHSDGRVVVAGL